MKNRYDTFRLFEAKKVMKQKIVFGLLSFWTACFQIPAVAHACSVCWAGDTGPTADAFNWSILFLMAAPYSVLGSIAGWLFYTSRRSAATREKSEAVEPLVQLTWNPEGGGR